MHRPTRCHLWQVDVLQSQDLRDIFEVVETFEDTSHFSRCLVRRRCGQLYFYQFHETIDWEDGDDPQYSPAGDFAGRAECDEEGVFQIDPSRNAQR